MPNIERPILILPTSDAPERAKKPGGPSRIARPNLRRQQERLNPQFQRLQDAFENRRVSLQNNPDGIEPELALVIVTVGSSANFLSAGKRIEGLEWLAETGLDGIEPDDDFFDQDNRKKELSGKYYCIMSDQRALKEMVSIWERYQANPDMEFEKGFSSFKDLFASLKELRTWSAEDRFADTGVIEQWRDELELKRGTHIPFEIELFYRTNHKDQEHAEWVVRTIVESMGGSILSRCVIDEISYHALAAELPPERIQELVDGGWDTIELAKTDQIMFFRPVAQMVDVDGTENTGFDAPAVSNQSPVYSEPIVALFDGVPIENHQLLRGRLNVDDPDEYAASYTVEQCVHGTEIASLIERGDLNNREAIAVSRILYVRPILKSAFMKETYPEGELIVDIIHRAVRRMKVGENGEAPTAPTVKVVNLSIGDSQRQYLNSISPLARLLDWLSWEYKLLFIVSAGNNLQPTKLQGDTDSFVHSTIEQRTHAVVNGVKDNNRNLRLFSPAESINSLTVGAIFTDHFDDDKRLRGVYPVEDNVPHPMSAIGPGVGRMIKPEIFLPGGRLRVNGVLEGGNISWAEFLSSGPGCRAAYPRSGQPTRGEGYAVGTSASAALASHAVHHLYDTLESVFLEQEDEGVPDEYAAIMLKAMLVHGADWETLQRAMDFYYEVDKQHAARWFGYGVPNFAKVRYCTENRVTTVGYGELKNGHAHEYHLPLPINLRPRSISRKVTVTLAYFSPIASKRKEYRKAQVWFTRDSGTERLVPLRANTDWQGVLRGTVQHEIFLGSDPIPWGDDDEICIKISCKQGTLTGAIGSAVPYAIFITIEVANPVGNIYDSIAERVRGRIGIHSQE